LLSEKIRVLREGLEAKGLRVNLAKTKVMKCEIGCGQVAKTGKYPCGVCNKGVGRNSIQYQKCKRLVLKKCNKIKGNLIQGLNFQCMACSCNVVHGEMVEDKEINIGSGIW
jgi:hypothetical protein